MTTPAPAVRQEKSTTDRLFPLVRSGRRVPLAASLPTWLSGRWAASLFATPRSSEPNASDHAFLETGKAFSVQGLAAWRWGSGPAVFLVHGWEGFGAQLAAFVPPLVKAGYTVVAIDAKAHGASPGVEATLSDFSDALFALEARMGAPAAVIAHSFGALGTLLALRRGLTARSAVLIAIPSPKDRLAAFRQELALGDAAVARMMAIVEKRVGVPFEAVEAQALAKGLTVPVLVMHDAKDRIASRATAEATTAALANATFRPTEGLGHYRILKDPAVVAAVTSFVGAKAGLVPVDCRTVRISSPASAGSPVSKRRHLPVMIGSPS